MAPLYIIVHEDGHYDKAFQYGLSPRISYLDKKVTYLTIRATSNQLADVAGAGVNSEQELQRELSEYRVTKDLSTIYSMREFAGDSTDGTQYFDLMPNERRNIKRAVLLDPLVYVSQILLNYYDSPFFVHSWTEIDRRGVRSFYKVSYNFSF